MNVRPFFLDVDAEDIHEFQEDAARILRSGALILGEYTERFERAFAEFVGVRHAVAVNSGSTALEILYRLNGVDGRTVLVPTNTNFATVASMLRAGGRVRYLDMDPRTFAPTLEMVREALHAERDVAGVVWVHIGGVVSPEFPEVVAHCRAQGRWVLEDAAHAHGSQLAGVKAGNLADGAAFSFFPTKVMTTFEGGMVTTNDAEADFLGRSLRNQGKRGVKFGGLHHDFGNSSRMTEIHAALGLLQLRRLPALLQRRARASRLITGKLDRAGLAYCSTAHMDAASHYKLIVLVPDGRRTDEVTRALQDAGVIVGGGVYEVPCHRQPVFADVGGNGSYPGADRWCPRHLCPPLTSGMSDDEAEYVGDMLVKLLA